MRGKKGMMPRFAFKPQTGKTIHNDPQNALMTNL